MKWKYYLQIVEETQKRSTIEAMMPMSPPSTVAPIVRRCHQESVELARYEELCEEGT